MIQREIAASVRRLAIDVKTGAGDARVVDDVSLQVIEGEILGLVGESGSGKSLTALAMMGLLPAAARVTEGEIEVGGRDILSLPPRALNDLRGSQIAMVFQEPMTALDPSLTIGSQIVEVIRRHRGDTKKEATDRAAELLTMVGISGARDRLRSYPHEMSGGMRQRVMIAMALSCEPRVLIADEPSTALDVTVQADLLDLLKTMRDRLGLAMVLITHDLGVVADVCDNVAVMYAGQIVEEGSVYEVLLDPMHPYTRALLHSVPVMGDRARSRPQLAGGPPPSVAIPTGCRFEPRCPEALPACGDHPVGLRTSGGRSNRCIRSHGDEVV